MLPCHPSMQVALGKMVALLKKPKIAKSECATAMTLALQAIKAGKPLKSSFNKALKAWLLACRQGFFQFCWMHMKMGQSLAPFFSLLWEFPLPRYYSCSILGLESPEVSKLLGWIAPTLLHREWVIMTWAGKAPLSTCRTTSFWPCSSKKKVQLAHALACIFGLDSPSSLWAMALQTLWIFGLDSPTYPQSLGWITFLKLLQSQGWIAPVYMHEMRWYIQKSISICIYIYIHIYLYIYIYVNRYIYIYTYTFM